MKMPISLRIIHIFTILNASVIGLIYLTLLNASSFYANNPYGTSWSTLLIELIIPGLPVEITDKMYVFGRLEVLLLITLLPAVLIWLSLYFKKYKLSIGFISFAILLFFSNFNLIQLILYITVLLVITLNKRAKAFLKRTEAVNPPSVA